MDTSDEEEAQAEPLEQSDDGRSGEEQEYQEVGEDDVVETVESDEQEAAEAGERRKKRIPSRNQRSRHHRSRNEGRADHLRTGSCPEGGSGFAGSNPWKRPRKAMPPADGRACGQEDSRPSAEHPLPEAGGEKPEKRKYKPRKPKNVEEGAASDVEKPTKEKKREKPKTPPLELRMEDFTQEQLDKPNKNYGLLIDEVLTEAPHGPVPEADLQAHPAEVPLLLLQRRDQGLGEQPCATISSATTPSRRTTRRIYVEPDARRRARCRQKRKASPPDLTPSTHNYPGRPWNSQAPHTQLSQPTHDDGRHDAAKCSHRMDISPAQALP